MTPRRRYTHTAGSGRKGSDQTRGNYPRDCHLCGQRVVVSGPNMRACSFKVDEHGVATSAHIDCLERQRAEAAVRFQVPALPFNQRRATA